jgi:hypothetical protein
MLQIPGLIVERVIPDDVLAGVMTGRYVVHGGVIRCAPGTTCAGQIVRHLLPVGDLDIFSLSGRLDELARGTSQILKMATATMTLSGLNLVVSAVGFAALNRKLDSIEGRLSQIQADVKEIKELLQQTERARIRAAIRELQRVEGIEDVEHRRAILHGARRDLGEIHERYLELLAGARTIGTASAYEEYFCVMALARSRCTAELGMLPLARQELAEATEFWREQAYRVTRELLIADAPERFLSLEYADVPFAEIARWLDFANEEARGYEWVDELRRREKEKSQATAWGFRNIGARFRGSQPSADEVVPVMQKLTHRSAVLDGYVTQYTLLAEANLSPSEFSRRLQDHGQTESTGGFLILRPVAELAA